MALEIVYDATEVTLAPALGLLAGLGLVAAARWDWRHRNRQGFAWYGPLSKSEDWRMVFTGIQLVVAVLFAAGAAVGTVGSYVASQSARAAFRDGRVRTVAGEIRGVPPPPTAPRGSQSRAAGWCSVGDLRFRDDDFALRTAIARTADAGRRLRDGDVVRIHLDASGGEPGILRFEVVR